MSSTPAPDQAPEIDVTVEIAKAWMRARQAIEQAIEKTEQALELAVAAGDHQTADQLDSALVELAEAMEATQS